MPSADQVMQVVREWLEMAEHDLRAAAHSMKLGRQAPTEIVGFHAQQCVEKYLKALLIARGVMFPGTHDIEELARLLPEGAMSGWAESEQRQLTRYAVATRYPGDNEPIPLTEARAAVRIARRVRREIRKLLPKETVRRAAMPRRRGRR